jgi:hypothetical protein
MSVPSQASYTDFAPQAAKIGKDGTFDATVVAWKRLNATRTNMGTQTRENNFPFELGDSIVTPDNVREAHFFAGDTDFLPRLEESFGYLLYAALGYCETTADVDVDGNAVVGMYTHRFKFDPNSSYTIPWMAWRCFKPSENALNDRGEISYDCAIANLSITVNQMGKIAARVSVMGRTSYWDNDVSDWDVTNTYEFGSSTPEAGRGQFKLAGTEYLAQGASVEFVNNLSDLNDEMIIGSFNPIGFIPKSRAAGIRFMSKYVDNKLTQKVLTGTETGTNWQSLPSYVETVGAVKAVDIRIESPENIPGTASPYRLIIQADRAALRRDGAPEMRPGSVIQEPYRIELIRPADGQEFIEIIIENGTPSYDWGTVANAVARLVMQDTLNYAGIPVLLDPLADLYDADAIDLSSASATLVMAGANYDNINDSLTPIANGPITIDTANIEYNGTVIATFAGDGKTASNLILTFNAAATLASVRAAIRAISYDRGVAPTTGNIVTADVTFNDGSNDSNIETVTITHL